MTDGYANLSMYDHCMYDYCNIYLSSIDPVLQHQYRVYACIGSVPVGQISVWAESLDCTGNLKSVWDALSFQVTMSCMCFCISLLSICRSLLLSTSLCTICSSMLLATFRLCGNRHVVSGSTVTLSAAHSQTELPVWLGHTLVCVLFHNQNIS